MPEQRVHLARASTRIWRAHHVAIVPLSQHDDGVVAQALAELPRDDLRLHRHVAAACRAPP